MGFISRIQERNAEITAQIAALVAERDENDAAIRALVRLGFDDNSAASTQEAPRPMEGAADRGEVRPGLAATYEPEHSTVSSGDFQREPASVPLVSEHLAGADAQRSTARPHSAPVPSQGEREADAVDLTASADQSTAARMDVLSQGEAEPSRIDEGRQATADLSAADTGDSRSGSGRSRQDGNTGNGASRVSDREPPAGTQAPPVDTHSPETAIAGEVGPETVGASPAPLPTGKPAGPSGSAAPSLRRRIEALHREHPEYTARQAREALDCKQSSLTAYSAMLLIKWTPERKPRQMPLQADPEPEAPEPATEPEPPQASTPEPANDMPRIVRPRSGSKFYLVNDAGLYLNRYAGGFTRDRREAWIGNESQLAGCRRNFDLARDLREVAVTKDQPAAINREVV